MARGEVVGSGSVAKVVYWGGGVFRRDCGGSGGAGADLKAEGLISGRLCLSGSVSLGWSCEPADAAAIRASGVSQSVSKLESNCIFFHLVRLIIFYHPRLLPKGIEAKQCFSMLG